MLTEVRALPDGPNDHRLGIDELNEVAAAANIPTLLMVIYQVSGDERWLNDPYRPTRSKGLGDHDSGGLPEEIQEEIRSAGAAAFSLLQDGHAPAIDVPRSELMTRM